MKLHSLLGASTLLLAVSSHPMQAAVEISGTWEHEWAVSTRQLDSDKFESLFKPRMDLELDETWRLTAIGRIRLDALDHTGPSATKPDNYSAINGPWYNNAHAEIGLREFYLDADIGGNYWRLGKQQVVWGEADGMKLLDVVNPQSYREFILDDFDDSRIPLWMLNVEIPVLAEGSLQLLWIPDTTYHELAEAGTTWEITSSALVPQAPPGVEVQLLQAELPGDWWQDSEIGIRYGAFVAGWDFSVNYLYHYQDFAVLYTHAQANGSVVVAPEYERNHLLGGALSNVFGDFTLRAELAYNSDTFHVSRDIIGGGIAETEEFASVLGLDWQGLDDTFISAQWFQSHLLSYQKATVREQTEHRLSLLYKREFFNQTWEFETQGLYSLNHQDSSLQLKLKYLIQSNLELWVGADLFHGDSDQVFGQFDKKDRMLFGLKLGF
ncbi:MAG: hypothetical protein ACI8QT_000404 [Halioglobus sp.]|jgi:hypothetical protein